MWLIGRVSSLLFAANVEYFFCNTMEICIASAPFPELAANPGRWIE